MASPVIEEKVQELIAGARREMDAIADNGGMVACVESGYVKRELVRSHTTRLREIESGDLQIVGVNCFKQTAESPLTQGADAGIMKVDAQAEQEQIAALQAFRSQRNAEAVAQGLAALDEAARSGANIMPASIECARAGVTTGEWAATLRDVFGEYRAPTGVDVSGGDFSDSEALQAVRSKVQATGEELGRPTEITDRQARFGRTQQRCRTNCRERSRCGLRNRL